MHSHDWSYHVQQVAFWPFLIGLLILLVLALWRGRRSNGGSDKAAEAPEQILKRRYANGEIDQQTYERMLGELRK
jgi:uncharacterized membrane protein